MKTHRKAALVAGIVLGIAGIAAVVAAARGSGPALSGSWAPGKSATLTAGTSVPVVAHPPTQLAEDITSAVGAMGGDSQKALSSLRLIRQDLGATHSDMYIYSPGDSGWCFFLWERQANCPSAQSSTTPGALYLLSPGGPGYVGQSDNVPAAVAGIVSDDIKHVSLIDDGTRTNLEIANNAFYSDLTNDPNSTFDVQLQFDYSDGSTTSVTLHNDGMITLPSK